ncbi:hypothetical protein ACIGFK_32150 [Streptomyces sp. NPDC085524]|uniref:hypothetical protein n=1 Tax=Streptomyces sp. NPDC085524 TaxID=3365728 RepID=UPI0037D8772E
MDGNGKARRKVADESWTWAVAAAWAAVAVSLVLAAVTDFEWLVLVFQVPVALPLLMRRTPKTFTVVCLLLGMVMLLPGLLLALFTLPVFVIAPPLLIVAAFADRSNRPHPAWLAVALAASLPGTCFLLTG